MAVCLLPRPIAAQTPPKPDEVLVSAASQEGEGGMYHLRGSATVETKDIKLWADEIDYNEETGDAHGRGNVHFKHLVRNEELWADKVDYNVQLQTGKFYNVHGSAPGKVTPRQGLLTTTNPFYFQGQWAERLKDRYILYNGFITDCQPLKPWWTLRAPRFDIIPQERALAFGSVFRLKRVPLLYAPVFYKSLEENPRKSGFLTPNLGNSSRRGKMVGGGYFWAINRSYDVTYQPQYFTARGLAHHLDFRGKPTARSDFNVTLFGVNDRGQQLSDGTRIKQGGFIISFQARSDFGHGFTGRLDGNYLSSQPFRTSWSESFNEQIASEVHTIGFIEKHWSSYGLVFEFARIENIQSPGTYDPTLKRYTEDQKILIRKLPEVDFGSRLRQILKGRLPVWVSMDSSAGLLRRSQSLFQTQQFVDRLDFRPRVMTALRWKGFSLLPSFSFRETHYGASQEQGRPTAANLDRFVREFTLEILPPSLARTFGAPHWLGDKLKHVIEPRLLFRQAAGIDNFNQIIRFDETELMSNTTEAEVSLTNRLYAKRGDQVTQIMSWEVLQRRYFDPTFGGAITGDLQRNVLLTSLQITPFSFLDGPRHYSPVVSVFRIDPVPGFATEWRADYDPLRHRFVDSWLSADWRHKIFYITLGHNLVRSVPQLSPNANQFRGRLVVGNDNRRGWNAAFDAIYDYRTGVMQYSTAQVTYNTDCCGFSVQFQRTGIAPYSQNKFRVSLSIANIGAFGTLKRQERLF